MLAGDPVDLTRHDLRALPIPTTATDTRPGRGIQTLRYANTVRDDKPQGNTINIPRKTGAHHPHQIQLKALLDKNFAPDAQRMIALEAGMGWKGPKGAVFPSNYGGANTCSLGLCNAVFGTKTNCAKDVNCELFHGWLSIEVIEYLLSSPNREHANKAKAWLQHAL